jgi:amino acid transporter
MTAKEENKPGRQLGEERSRSTEPQLKRALGARHLQMLAIASSIGTGLFIGSGKALSTGGPFSLVFSFAWLGLVLTTMMRE